MARRTPTQQRETGNMGPGRPPAERGARERVEERNHRALQLRLAGLTFREIATELQVSPSVAHDAVNSALAVDRERTASLRDEYRSLQLARIERAIRALWPQAVVGQNRYVNERNEQGDVVTVQRRVFDGPALDRIVKLLDRQARLLGLDAPVRVAVSDQTRSEVENMIAGLEAMLVGAAEQ